MNATLEKPTLNPRERFDAARNIPNLVLKLQGRECRRCASEEWRLIELAMCLSCVGCACSLRNPPKAELRELYAFVWAWLGNIWPEKNDFLDAIADAIFAERQRQVGLRLANPKKYTLAMEHPTPDVSRKFRVLFEECGEVADALDKLESASAHERPWAKHELVKELIQVAAVTVAWLESYEVQS